MFRDFPICFRLQLIMKVQKVQKIQDRGPLEEHLNILRETSKKTILTFHSSRNSCLNSPVNTPRYAITAEDNNTSPTMESIRSSNVSMDSFQRSFSSAKPPINWVDEDNWWWDIRRKILSDALCLIFYNAYWIILPGWCNWTKKFSWHREFFKFQHRQVPRYL